MAPRKGQLRQTNPICNRGEGSVGPPHTDQRAQLRQMDPIWQRGPSCDIASMPRFGKRTQVGPAWAGPSPRRTKRAKRTQFAAAGPGRPSPRPPALTPPPGARAGAKCAKRSQTWVGWDVWGVVHQGGILCQTKPIVRSGAPRPCRACDRRGKSEVGERIPAIPLVRMAAIFGKQENKGGYDICITQYEAPRACQGHTRARDSPVERRPFSTEPLIIA
jgi:hypothetical protein